MLFSHLGPHLTEKILSEVTANSSKNTLCKQLIEALTIALILYD